MWAMEPIYCLYYINVKIIHLFVIINYIQFGFFVCLLVYLLVALFANETVYLTSRQA